MRGQTNPLFLRHIVAVTTPPFARGTWTHVAGTYDGATLRLFINGQEVAHQDYAGGITYNAAGTTLGARDSAGDFAWPGALDEIRVCKHIPVDKRHNAKIDYPNLYRLLDQTPCNEVAQP